MVECIQLGREISFDCFISNLASNWVSNLENFWLNYTPFGIIINYTEILDNNYKCIVGKVQTLSCKDSQVLHLSLCYNKDEILQDSDFIVFNSIDWKETFGRNCTLNQKNTGFIYLNPPSFLQSETYGWIAGNKPFSLDGARERCEKHYSPGTYHSCISIIYLLIIQKFMIVIVI
jgi:hypothetical protein